MGQVLSHSYISEHGAITQSDIAETGHDKETNMTLGFTRQQKWELGEELETQEKRRERETMHTIFCRFNTDYGS